MPRSRASEARCEVEPPSSATTPDTLRQNMGQRRTGDLGHQHIAGRNARQFAFAVDDHGAAGAPADAGRMAVDAGMCEPDGVGHDRRFDMQRPRLQQPEAGSSIAHSISTGEPASASHLRSRRPSVTASPGVRHGCAHHDRRAPVAARQRRAHRCRDGFCGPASIMRRKPLRASTMRSGTTSPCAIAEPRPQVAEISICPSAVSLKAAAGGARGNQRLDQHRHRGVGRRQPVIFHVAAGMRCPQRRPAGAHGGEEFAFICKSKEAFELAGEIGAFAVFDQRRGAHRAERSVRPLGAPELRAMAPGFPAL